MRSGKLPLSNCIILALANGGFFGIFDRLLFLQRTEVDFWRCTPVVLVPTCGAIERFGSCFAAKVRLKPAIP
uniref:Uncharacterized protein n=1 Tax=Physcomitrium patens TaxID=3218 RepID=A0A2K1IWV6_PHYPA|nr:hypothetical protein PHYPA_023575 [Physcomitrium patens]